MDAGATTTRFLESMPEFRPHAIEIVAPGMGTTVQVLRMPGNEFLLEDSLYMLLT